MCSAICDNCEDDENNADIGYAMLVDKHINKYERIFEKNEKKFNRYRHIEQVVDRNNNDHNYCVEIKNEPIEADKQQKTTTIRDEKNIYKSLYKKWTHYHIGCEKPTHVYTCQWWTCRYETSSRSAINKHLTRKHIVTKLFQYYSRSFVELNVYQYKCLRCEYETKIVDNILLHVKTELKPWKCCVETCCKRFPTQDELSYHEKRHFCVFKLNSRKYMKGDGVCSFNSIRQYYQNRKVIDGSEVCYRYVCQWSECAFQTYNCRAIQNHIHYAHICPLFNETKQT